MKLVMALLFGLVLLSTSLAFKVHELGQELTAGLRDASGEVREAEEISRALRERIHNLRPPPLSLAGTESTSGRQLSIEEVDFTVLYYFGTECPFSPINVPFLNKLHAAGVDVIGVSPDERWPVIAKFAQDSGATFPLLANPTGGAIDVLPRGAVPLTVVFLNGKMEVLWLGPLSEERQKGLEAQLGLAFSETLEAQTGR